MNNDAVERAIQKDIPKLGHNLAYAKFYLSVMITELGRKLGLDLVTTPMLLRMIAEEMEQFRTIQEAERILYKAQQHALGNCRDRRQRHRRNLGS